MHILRWLTPRLYGGIFVPQRALPANLVAKTCSNSPFTPSDPHLKFSDNLFCRGLKYRGCREKCTGRFWKWDVRKTVCENETKSGEREQKWVIRSRGNRIWCLFLTKTSWNPGFLGLKKIACPRIRTQDLNIGIWKIVLQVFCDSLVTFHYIIW